MYSNFKEQAIEYVKQAVKEDTAGNYAKAFPLYMNALEYFKIHLKYEQNPKIKEAITLKFNEYLRRAEEIRAVLDDRDASVAARPKNYLVHMSVSKEQAFEDLKQAVKEDDAENYVQAFHFYMNALEYFKNHLKYEKNPEIKEAITQKFNDYIGRAHEIRAVLDDTDVTTWPKSKLKDGEGGSRDNGGGCGSGSGGDGGGNGEDQKPLYLSFEEQAMEYVKQAVKEDNAGNYAKAFPLYMNALEYFKTYLKYEKNLKHKLAINKKFTEYLHRAEEVRAILDYGRSGLAVNGDAFVATQPESKPNDVEAEEIRVVLDDGGSRLDVNGDVVVETQPESKPKDGEGGNGSGAEGVEQAELRSGLNTTLIREGGGSEGEEHAELKSGLNSTIVREKPKGRWWWQRRGGASRA